MKKLLILIIIFFTFKAFSQRTEKNGVIYKEHPYIEVVKHIAEFYQKGDVNALANAYSDTAKIYGMTRYNPDTTKTAGFSEALSKSLSQAKAGWQQVLKDWEKIQMKSISSPDGLEYSNSPFTVQSWWSLTLVNKKTKKEARVEMVLFDMFNKDGKIITQLEYYDPSSLVAAMK